MSRSQNIPVYQWRKSGKYGKKSEMEPEND
jgi:hypothetical protein